VQEERKPILNYQEPDRARPTLAEVLLLAFTLAVFLFLVLVVLVAMFG
jgi:hypothetical protein